MGHQVTLVPGDGTGPELTRLACEVLSATGVEIAWDIQQVGTPAVEMSGTPLPDGVLDAILATGAALKGPVTTPAGPGGFPSVNVALRRRLDLFAQVRPCRSWPGVASPCGRLDLVVIRDTTEGLYAGAELAPGAPETVAMLDLLNAQGGALDPRSAVSVKPVSEQACRRIARFAFDYARSHGYERVTAVHKASVMRRTDGLFLEVARDVAGEHPALVFDDCLVDAACAQLVRRPEGLQVLVTLNLYGDILSDLAAALAGGVGLAPGANVGPRVAVFEAAHGSAPKLAGRRRANPVGLILSGALLLRHLGEQEAAARVESAVASVLAQGRTLTYDLRRSPGAPVASSDEVAAAVIAHL
ncbi:MAG: isocitrate/isopropylmalate dehydrogenase family protein [Acidimicrobiales bacterium]